MRTKRAVVMVMMVMVMMVMVMVSDLVAAAVAVVGRAEDGDHISVMAPVVPLHHQLVRP